MDKEQERTTDGVGALAGLEGEPYCYLTTVGRRSGRDHTIEIWFALVGSTVYLLSGGGPRSDWVRNLRADPSVTVRLRDTTYDAVARVVDPGTDEDVRARQIVTDKYQPRYSGSLDAWRARSLPVALEVR